MTPRAVTAVAVALVLLLSGCANEQPPKSFTAPAATGAAGSPAAGQPSPSAGPTTPKPAPTTPRPKKPAPRAKIGPYDTVRLTGVRGVALTFDDGPHPDWTPKVLDQLKAAKVKATFCVVGVKVRKYPQLVARIVREGHTLCNHSWSHDFELGKKTEPEIRADLELTTRVIRRAVPNARVGYYRQPGGKWTPSVVKVARELGMKPLHWDVDPADWEKPSAQVITDRILKQVRAGSIVLLHDGGGDRANTLGAVPGVIRTLKQKYGIVLLK